MRIAQVAPLWERVPPETYGGTERIVHFLTEELVRRGHDVTLYASGDSQTRARLISPVKTPLREANVLDATVYDLLLTSMVYGCATDFDVIHNHLGMAPLVTAPLVKTPTVTTLHGIFTEEAKRIFRFHSKLPFVSISDAQREPLPELNYMATVYNCVPTNRLEFVAEPDKANPYLAFLGRMSPEKGIDLAVELARISGWRLLIAGKIDVVDRNFWEEQIEPLVDGEQIQYLGEMDDVNKAKLLGGATATLCLIQWHEPFGLVMAESLACGTPVIATPRGSVPEIIKDGVTGFICENIEEMSQALTRIGSLDRSRCRREVEKRFSISQMTDGYEVLYTRLCAQKTRTHGATSRP